MADSTFNIKQFIRNLVSAQKEEQKIKAKTHILQDVGRLTLKNHDSTVEFGRTSCLLQESRYLAPKINNLGVSKVLKKRTTVA